MSDIVVKVKGALDIDEVQVFLGVGQATIYRWMNKGLLNPIQIDNKNFFPISELERLKNKQAVSDELTA